MIFLILGPPGAGKGTQTELLCKEIFGLNKLSTGDLLRDNIKRRTGLGLEVEAVIAQGKLVSDEILDKIVVKEINSLEPNCLIILDGYPRTVNQVQSLENSIKNGTVNHEFSKVFFINVPLKTLQERLSGRRTCSLCSAPFHVYDRKPKIEGVCDNCGGGLVIRPDDEIDKVRTRFEVYSTQTEPVLSKYKLMGKLIEIDGNRAPEEITKELVDLIMKYSAKLSHHDG